jgi:hypothetical protein
MVNSYLRNNGLRVQLPTKQHTKHRNLSTNVLRVRSANKNERGNCLCSASKARSETKQVPETKSYLETKVSLACVWRRHVAAALLLRPRALPVRPLEEVVGDVRVDEIQLALLVVHFRKFADV